MRTLRNEFLLGNKRLIFQWHIHLSASSTRLCKEIWVAVAAANTPPKTKTPIRTRLDKEETIPATRKINIVTRTQTAGNLSIKKLLDPNQGKRKPIQTEIKTESFVILVVLNIVWALGRGRRNKQVENL